MLLPRRLKCLTGRNIETWCHVLGKTSHSSVQVLASAPSMVKVRVYNSGPAPALWKCRATREDADFDKGVAQRPFHTAYYKLHICTQVAMLRIKQHTYLC